MIKDVEGAQVQRQSIWVKEIVQLSFKGVEQDLIQSRLKLKLPSFTPVIDREKLHCSSLV
jgi:hypothetical protein